MQHRFAFMARLVSACSRRVPIDAAMLTGMSARFRWTPLVDEPLSRGLASDPERDADLIPRSAVSPRQLDSLPRSRLVLADGLGGRGHLLWRAQWSWAAEYEWVFM